MEWMLFKEVCSRGCFSLNMLRQVLKESIERGGRRNFDHARLVDQLTQRLPFRHPSCTVIALRGLQRLQKFRPVEPYGITERFEVFFGDLDVKTLLGPPRDFRLHRARHVLRLQDDTAISVSLTNFFTESYEGGHTERSL